MKAKSFACSKCNDVFVVTIPRHKDDGTPNVGRIQLWLEKAFKAWLQSLPQVYLCTQALFSMHSCDESNSTYVCRYVHMYIVYIVRAKQSRSHDPQIVEHSQWQKAHRPFLT
jgi:hypothetical protein